MESTQRKTAAPSAEPDAGLLRLNAEYREFLAELNAGKHRDAKGDVSDEARERMCGLEQKIADTPAATYAGIGIKLLIGVDNFCPLNPGETRTTDELNLESALADAERLAGATSSTVAPETTAEDPFEALAAEWAEQKADCERLAKAEREADVAVFGAPSDAANERLGEIGKRISETPTTTILGIVTKLQVEYDAEVDLSIYDNRTDHQDGPCRRGAPVGAVKKGGLTRRRIGLGSTRPASRGAFSCDSVPTYRHNQIR